MIEPKQEENGHWSVGEQWFATREQAEQYIELESRREWHRRQRGELRERDQNILGYSRSQWISALLALVVIGAVFAYFMAEGDDEPAGAPGISHSLAMSKCKDLIKARATNPGTVSFNEILGSSYYKAPETGNVRLVLDFQAKNGIGLESSFRGVCTFEPSGVGDISITEK